MAGSDVHFWKHGRVGDTMVVSDVVRQIRSAGLPQLLTFSLSRAVLRRPRERSRSD